MTKEIEKPTAVNLSIVPLKGMLMPNFIQCYAYREFHLLDAEARANFEDYTPEEQDQLLKEWQVMLLEFYELSGEEEATRLTNLNAHLQYYLLRASLVDSLLSALSNSFDEGIADVLRNDPAFKGRLHFTKETYVEDMKHAVTIERMNVHHFEVISRDIKEMQNKNGVQANPKQLEDVFIERLITINEVLKSNYQLEALNARMFAMLWRRAYERIQYANQPTT